VKGIQEVDGSIQFSSTSEIPNQFKDFSLRVEQRSPGSRDECGTFVGILIEMFCF